MSYNVTHSEYISGKLWIRKKVLEKLVREYGDDIAEGNFVTDERALKERDKDSWDIVYLWWYGGGSGSCYDSLLEILKHCRGRAKILLVWEGGDKQTALSVYEGRVREGKVRVVVEEEE